MITESEYKQLIEIYRKLYFGLGYESPTWFEFVIRKVIQDTLRIEAGLATVSSIESDLAERFRLLRTS
jgi:hypothetical protein